MENNNEGWDRSANPFETKSKKNNFLQGIKAGDKLTIRFLSDLDDKEHFKLCFRHRFVKDIDGNRVGDITCINSKENLRKGIICPLCEQGLKAVPRFLTIVIDRADKEAKLMDQGRQIYELLQKHKNDNGTINNVDFIYSREGSTWNDTKYSIVPLLKTVGPLIKNEIDLLSKFDLEKFIAEKSRDEILELLGKRINKEREDSDMSDDKDVVPF